MTVDVSAAGESTPTGVLVVDDDVVICRRMAAGLSSAGYQVAISIDGKADLMARFDPALAVRVLHNLVGNAARYCNPGGTIAVSAQRWNDDGVELSVTNSGPQIPRTSTRSCSTSTCAAATTSAGWACILAARGRSSWWTDTAARPCLEVCSKVVRRVTTVDSRR